MPHLVVLQQDTSDDTKDLGVGKINVLQRKRYIIQNKAILNESLFPVQRLV